MKNVLRLGLIMRRDVPPTAGLPMAWADFLPRKNNFAQNLSIRLGIPRPILCASGTAALVIALKTLADNSPRNTVIVPAFSCPLVVLAIAHCGLKVQLCDTQPTHFDFDFDQLKALTNHQTLAVISTHMGGRLADVATAKQIAHASGAYVIEDAAWATGARQNSKSVGLTGDIGFFSLAVGKGLTTFEGGVLFSALPELQDRLGSVAQKLLPAKWLWELRRSLELINYALFYRPQILPYVYGAQYRYAVQNNDWLTALGDCFSANIPMHSLGKWRQVCASHALMRLADFQAKTRMQAQLRIEQLRKIPNLQIIADGAGDDGVWPFIMVVFPNQAGRDVALKQLTPLGLGVSRLFAYALNEYDYLKPYVNLDNMPAAADFAQRLLTISNSLWLRDPEFETVLAHIKAALGG